MTSDERNGSGRRQWRAALVTGTVTLLVIAVMACGGVPGSVSGDALSMGDYLDARWPSRPAFSPGSHHVSFLWTDWQTQDLYVASVDGGPWDVRNGWMYARLGTPEENPEAYYNASALNFLDDLQAPVLTVQGIADVHVNFLQSIKLVDELLRRGKRFKFEVYPGEPHFFSRKQSWVDAFGKMERFFDEQLFAARRSLTSTTADPGGAR